MPSPLFVTGLARSGTTLLSQMLSAHEQVMVAADPYLFFFRSFRNTVVFEAGLGQGFDPATPFQDYYFCPRRLAIMEAVQKGTLDLPVNREEWHGLYERNLGRLEAQCPDLVPYLSSMDGRSYKDLLDRGLEIITTGRQVAHRKWVGLKEVWIVEFLPALARAYPQAKFMVLFRDPRGMLASHLALARRDPSQLAHPLSFLRHWRKYMAFLFYFLAEPSWSNRLFFLRYEDLVADPEKMARQMCEFLEIDFDPNLLDTDQYFDYTTKQAWAGNSSFQETTRGIKSNSAERWRQSLEPVLIELSDLICGPDMAALNYQPIYTFEGRRPRPEVLEYLIAANMQSYSWRSDFKDPQKDYGFELFRLALAELPSPPADPQLIRQAFLFERAYRELRAKVRLI